MQQFAHNMGHAMQVAMPATKSDDDVLLRHGMHYATLGCTAHAQTWPVLSKPLVCGTTCTFLNAVNLFGIVPTHVAKTSMHDVKQHLFDDLR